MSDEVLRAVADGGRVRVVVALRPPAVAGKSAGAQQAAIRTLQRHVVAAVVPDGFRRLDDWRSTPGLAGELTSAGLAALAANPDVLRVDVEHGGSISLLESVPLVGGTAAHERGLRAAGVTVAVIDTGVDGSHPDLAGAVVDERCFCTSLTGAGCCPNHETEQRGPGAAADEQGHGTGVAGIVASRGAVAGIGMAPDAKIVAIRVMDSSGRYEHDSVITSAFDYLLTEHPEVRVVNLSLGSDEAIDATCDGANAQTLLWAQQVAALRARGTAVVASSGNHAAVGAMTSPACVSGVWSVGATYDAPQRSIEFGVCGDAGVLADDIACFSDTAATLSFLAPGAIITSSARGGRTQRMVGTSAASPHVAGAAALLFGRKPSASFAEIEALLTRTGIPIVDSRNGIRYPRIDVGAAAAELDKTLVAPSPRRRAAGH